MFLACMYLLDYAMRSGENPFPTNQCSATKWPPRCVLIDRRLPWKLTGGGWGAQGRFIYTGTGSGCLYFVVFDRRDKIRLKIHCQPVYLIGNVAFFFFTSQLFDDGIKLEDRITTVIMSIFMLCVDEMSFFTIYNNSFYGHNYL